MTKDATTRMRGRERTTMKHLRDLRGAGRLLRCASAAAPLLLLAAGQASAATPDVCESGCPYTQLAPALAAAHAGDTIKIGPGNYTGGITIDMSVKIVGAGSSATIRGGGPVLTIGVAGAASEPTVTIRGVTIRDLRVADAQAQRRR